MQLNTTLILGAILAIILSFGGGFIAGDIHRGGVDKKDQVIEIAKGNDGERTKEQKRVEDHNDITKNTLGEKDAIEKNRILFNTQYSSNFVGLRSSNASLPSGANPAFGIGGKALRFSEADAEFLNNFASSCEVVEAERNEVILKYESLK